MATNNSGKHTLEKQTRIDLTLAYFTKGEVPSEIAFDDCVLPGIEPIEGHVQGYYGQQSQAGIAHATYVAQSEGMICKAVLASVLLEASDNFFRRPPPLEQIGNTEYLNCARLSSSIATRISDFWYEDMKSAGWSTTDLDTIKWGYPERFIPLHTEAVSRFLQEPEMRGIKLFVYPTRLSMPSPIKGIVYVGVTRRENIASARMRYFEQVTISI